MRLSSRQELWATLDHLLDGRPNSSQHSLSSTKVFLHLFYCRSSAYQPGELLELEEGKSPSSL